MYQRSPQQATPLLHQATISVKPRKTALSLVVCSILSAGFISPVFAAPGDVEGSEFLVNSHTASHQRKPSIAMDADGDFVVSWQSYNQDDDGYGVYAQRYSADGTEADAEFLVNSHTTYLQPDYHQQWHWHRHGRQP